MTDKKQTAETDAGIEKRQNATISDAEIEKVRGLIGVWLRRDVHAPQISEPLSQHDIRRWATCSIGDDNPLWTDADYGRKTIWGRTIAPPTFLYSVDSGIASPGLPGVQWIHGGSNWENYLPVSPGDQITARARMTGMEEKQGRRVARFLIQHGEVLYLNQRDEVVSRLIRRTLRVPRAGSGAGLKKERDGAHELTKYSRDEIEKITQAYLNEYRRGSDTLYWEDVPEGEVLPSIVKGPLTMVDIMAFYMGRRTAYPPLKLAFLERIRHPSNSYIDPETGIPVHPAAGHLDVRMAQRIGVPAAYDQGWMRINWLGHLLTNWAGDTSFVRNLNVQLPRFNFVGDVTWCHGKVVGKTVKDGEHLVHIDCWSENQHGERNAEGSATIRLPSRDPSDLFLFSAPRLG